MVVLMGTEKVVVGDPERHVIVGAIVIVVTAADPVSGFKRAVKPFDHLLVGAELLRDRIIVCESDYLGNVKLEAVSQLPYELLGGQRISTIAVGNEPKLLGSLLCPGKPCAWRGCTARQSGCLKPGSRGWSGKRHP